MSKGPRTRVFFAHPYSSFERGTNENHNGIIRRFIPKENDIGLEKKSRIRRIQDWMNHSPRKILDGKSPLEALVDELGAGIQIPKPVGGRRLKKTGQTTLQGNQNLKFFFKDKAPPRSRNPHVPFVCITEWRGERKMPLQTLAGDATASKQPPASTQSGGRPGLMSRQSLGKKSGCGITQQKPKTLKTLVSYYGWTRKFQTFVQSKSPALLDTDDVKHYLTWLAMERDVVASTQNQAFNVLLFFIDTFLSENSVKLMEWCVPSGVNTCRWFCPGRRSTRLSAKLEFPFDLVGKLLYGCGLHIS